MRSKNISEYRKLENYDCIGFKRMEVYHNGYGKFYPVTCTDT